MNNLLSELELAKNDFRLAVRLSAGDQGSWIADRYIEAWSDTLSVSDLIKRLKFEAKIRHFIDGINLDDLVDLYQSLEYGLPGETDRIGSDLIVRGDENGETITKTCRTGQIEELSFTDQSGDVKDFIYFVEWLNRKLDFRCVGEITFDDK